MEKFDHSSWLGIVNLGDRAKLRILELEMEDFELNSRLGIRNGEVRAKFDVRNRKWRSSSQVPPLEIGN